MNYVTENILLYRQRPLKVFTRAKKNSAGRNNTGHITSYHRGNDIKRLYRVIDNHRKFQETPAGFLNYEIDPNRTGVLALICYRNGFLSYILATHGLNTRSLIMSSIAGIVSKACNMLLANITIGAHIYNIENIPNSGGCFIKAGGTSGQLLRRNEKFAFIKLQSGEIRKISINCYASIGSVLLKPQIQKTKAGINRCQGKRPIVRGVAMNPVDHPMGGGEGKSSGGRPSVSPWGILTKGGWRTRSSKNNKHIITNRKQ